ncbi:MAG: ATP-binding protein [Bdellovibrio sp.]|nr:ATP-binding protein [Bdellovibrio sp.]
MKRHALKDLTNWYKREKRKPLVLRGARQVGKSTLVRHLADSLGLDLFEINLEKQKLLSLQSEGIEVSPILQEVEIICNKKISAKALLFFDEAQDQKKILATLRYFFEEYPDIAVIAAGSLLDFALKKAEYSVPVGRIEYYFLGPMKFTEFLEAMGEPLLLEKLNDFSGALLEATHHRLMRRWREYLYVGGMPEAVLTYLQTNSPLEVRRIQNAILQAYQEDFNKYALYAQYRRVRRIFNFVPGHLGQKLKYVEIDPDEKARDLKAALELLILARVFIPVYHTNASGLPLKSQMDESVFKCYFLDVGLVCAFQGVDWSLLTTSSSEELLVKGPLVEQFVAQHLFFQSEGFMEPELFYWLRDKKAQNAEVDFVMTIDGQIVPVEVKSGKGGRLKSLMVFMKEKELPVALRTDINLPSSELIDQKINESMGRSVFELKNMPLYLIEKIVDVFRKL